MNNLIGKEIPYLQDIKWIAVPENYYQVPVPDDMKVIDLGDGLGLVWQKPWMREQEDQYVFGIFVRQLEDGTWVSQSLNITVKDHIITELEWLDEPSKLP